MSVLPSHESVRTRRPREADAVFIPAGRESGLVALRGPTRALAGHGGYVDGAVTTGPLLLTIVGFGFLTLGGWLGGTVVVVHGMRVLDLAEEPETTDGETDR
jgi:hypothetical protein